MDRNIIVHSDNCKSQYKSAQHFYGIQCLSNRLNCQVICVFGVANHGKGEVDHVGGLAKVSVRLSVASGETFYCSADMVEYLSENFKDKRHPPHFYKELLQDELDVARAEASLTRFQTIAGCDNFQVMIFNPHSQTINSFMFVQEM